MIIVVFDLVEEYVFVLIFVIIVFVIFFIVLFFFCVWLKLFKNKVGFRKLLIYEDFFYVDNIEVIIFFYYDYKCIIIMFKVRIFLN